MQDFANASVHTITVFKDLILAIVQIRSKKYRGRDSMFTLSLKQNFPFKLSI